MREPIIRQRNSKSCDFCALKKQKCKITEGQACAACNDLNQPCTFDREIKKRGMKIGFVQKLKKEVFHLQTLVEQKSFHEALAGQSEQSLPITSQSISFFPFSSTRTSNTSGESLPSSTDQNSILADSPGVKTPSYYTSSGGTSFKTTSISLSTDSGLSSSSSLKIQSESATKRDLSVDPLAFASNAIDHDHIRQNLNLNYGFESQVKKLYLIQGKSPTSIERSELTHNNSFSEEKFDSYDKLENWSVLTFYLLTIQASPTNSRPFLDIYFEKVFPKIPLLHKSWILDNMSDIPLWLFHIMYACCLENEVDSENKKLSLYHYEYCFKYLMNNLDDSNPFHVVASLHCMVYIIQNDPSNMVYITHLGTCVQIAQVLGLHSDQEYYWTSPIGTILGNSKTPLNQNFLRSLWFLLYRYDWAVYIVHDHDFFIGIELNENSLKKWSMPVLEKGNLFETHYLYHFQILAPILESVKKVLYSRTEQGSEITNYRLEALVDIDNNLSKSQYAPIHSKDYSNCDASVRHFLETYHFSRLCLLKSEIAHYIIDSANTQPSFPALYTCKNSAKIILELAKASNPKTNRPEYRLEQVHTYFHAGLFLIVIGFLCGPIELEQMRDSIEGLISALELIIPEDSKELTLLKEFNPESAFDELFAQ